MEKGVKWLLGLGGAGLLWASVSASRLARFSKEFQLTTNVRIQSISFTNLVLAIDIVFKNPTDASLTVKHPTVYIYDQDPTGKYLPTPIQTSTVENRVYQIKPNSETKINPVIVDFSLFSSTFLISGYTIIKRVAGGQPVVLWLRALSQVNGTVPVTQTQSFTLNGKKK